MTTQTYRIYHDGYPNGHAYVDPAGAAYLRRNDLSQPGHTIFRYSVRNEDLSDATQTQREREEETRETDNPH